MTIRTFSIAAAFAMSLAPGLSGYATAQDAENPVVVELYTSQGCSSCPPADKLLHELAGREGVIALALHVDYWDYIGWEDVFADPKHADRQRAYSQKAGKRMIYTPQMIIDGQSHVIGNKPMAVADELRAHGEAKNPIKVTLQRNGQQVSIAAMGEATGIMDVHLVRYAAEETVEITRGENRGKTLSYANIVREFRTLGRWDGASPLDLKADAPGDLPVVVLIQQSGHGPILGAAALR